MKSGSVGGGRPPLAPSTLNHTVDPSSSLNQVKKSFVFGSSTPRELSHIDKVSRKARLISGSSDNHPLAARSDEGKEKRGPGISFYMRQARSITPAGGRGDKSTSWAFGSSTPREFSHLKNIRADQRVYDAKMNHKPDVKSLTICSISDKPVSPAKPQSSGNSRLLMGNHVAKSINSRLSDDASSEPDIVQDRAIDFHRKATAIKLLHKSEDKDKKVSKGGNKASKENSTKKGKESVKATEDKKYKKSVEKKGKLEKKSPQEEQFQELSTETGQKMMLLKQTHEDSTNEKVVRVPAVRAHDDASEVLLDDEEIAVKPAPTSDGHKEEKENKNSGELDSKSTSNSEENETTTLSPRQETTQDSGRST